MYSAFNNLQAMKVNFRNRKIHLNLPKTTQHKLSDKKDPQQLIQKDQSTHHIKPITPFGSNIKVSKNNQHERIQMDHSKEAYIDSIADTIQLIGQEYVNYLNEGKEERFRASILSSITKLQARDRKIILEYSFNCNSHGEAEFDFQKDQDRFKEWLGEVHFKIVSTSFDFQINKLLTYEEVKVYCSQNLLLNIILFIQKVQNRITGISLTDFMMFIDQALHENIEYLMVKYPQAKQMKPNKRLRAQVQPINNMQNDLNDILQFSKVKFQLNESQNYNSQIMKFINYLIEMMTEETTIQGKKYQFAEGFHQVMEEIFQIAYLPETCQQQLKDKKLGIDQYKTALAELFQTNKEVKQYKQKVSKYSSYKMGTKINPNTETYKDSQIKAGLFQVKSTSILRILTKWIEQLQKKIFQAKEYIQKRSFRFKNINGGYSKLNASQKNDLYLQATKQIQNLKMFIKNIRQNAFSIQGQLAMTIKRSKQRVNIPKHQYLVGQFSSKLQDAASSSLLSYLNQLIHILLLIPNNIKSKYNHDDQLLKQMQIDLVTFKISDLLRCKFSSHQNEIVRIYKQLKRISDQKDYIKIVRIKDRLELGTRDILINVNYQNIILCEIQLAVTDQIDTKQQAFDAFNHYLYQLKRSNLGSIMQSACIWAHFDQRSRIYKKIKQKQLQQYYTTGTVKRVIHNCKQPLIDNDLPFVCSICSKFYFSQQGIIKHKKCIKCQKYYQCALCLENKFTQLELKKFLGLDKSLGIFSDVFVEWNGEEYPKNGLIIPKKNKRVEFYFFTTILWKDDAYVVNTQQEFNNKTNMLEARINVMIIVKNNQRKEWKRLKQTYIIYEWQQKRNINRTLKPDSIAQEQRNQQLRRDMQERQKREKKQRQIEQIKKKWRIKSKKDKQSRPNSAQSKESNHSKKSQKSMFSKQSQDQKKQKQKPKQISKNPKLLTKPVGMATIQQQKKFYNQSIAKRSDQFQIRVAIKTITSQDQFKQTHYLVLGRYFKQKHIRAQLKMINNNKVIRQNLDRKMQVLFLQDLLIQDQFQLQQKQFQKYSNSLSKINQIYLDSNLISNLQFLQKMPKLNVIHLNYNLIDSMQSFQSLKDLTQLMLQYNKIEQIKGLNGKEKLVQVNLNHNQVKLLYGLDKLMKLQMLTLADNCIRKIEGLVDLVNLKKLDLSYNFIQHVQGLSNLIKLEELDISDNYIRVIQGLDSLTYLRKLNLHKNKIKKIDGLAKLKQLKFLDLHRNLIVRIQNLSQLENILVLNLAGNHIRKIQGLLLLTQIIQLNLSQNEITSLKPLIENNMINLKCLDLSYNGIKKLIAELFQFIPTLEQFYINSNPLRMTKNQRVIHENLSKVFQAKSEFPFRVNMQKMETVDTESQEEDDDGKMRKGKNTQTVKH